MCAVWNVEFCSAAILLLILCEAPRIPSAPFVPDEDWDMESDESPAPPPTLNEKSRKPKSSSNPPLDEAVQSSGEPSIPFQKQIFIP
jgi:hypothetical protein